VIIAIPIARFLEIKRTPMAWTKGGFWPKGKRNKRVVIPAFGAQKKTRHPRSREDGVFRVSSAHQAASQLP
jgi:hypothetical protein